MPFLEGGKGLDSKNLRPIEYYGQTVMVTQEVAEFLDKDDLYMQAQRKKERRHMDMRRIEDIYNIESCDQSKAVEDQASENYFISRITELSATVLSEEIQSLKDIIVWYYCDGLSMEAIGGRLGISKAAVSKRHKKILKRLKEELHLDIPGEVPFLLF